MTFLFVGAGISNISLARLLAENGKTVRIIDRKAHIGGNCFDYFDENSIDIHAYGTHIFHTDDAEVWRFLSQFTQWYPYQHEVKALVDGQLVPVPFNFNSIEQLFPKLRHFCLNLNSTKKSRFSNFARAKIRIFSS